MQLIMFFKIIKQIMRCSRGAERAEMHGLIRFSFLRKQGSNAQNQN